jgi:adenylylsulfate kinase
MLHDGGLMSIEQESIGILSQTTTEYQTSLIAGLNENTGQLLRWKDLKRRGLTVWLTGLSSAGKTTISQALSTHLRAVGYPVEMLDGDVVRQHLCKGLGFSKQDRDENVRRIGFVADLLTRNGVIVLVSAISPYRAVREEMRRRIGSFVEVYVNASLEVCERRDVKGLYRKARSGQLSHFTGLDDPYEPPLNPEVECCTDREDVAESTERVLRFVVARPSQSDDTHWLERNYRRLAR